MRAITFFKNNMMFTVSLAAAIVTAFFVTPDMEYLSYFDLKTLACLFCVLAVICSLKNLGFFYWFAETIVRRFNNARLCSIALVYITFLGSMLITNDMALLTFLPLGYFVLSSTGTSRYMAYVFVLQNIAANLGGMLTPFGNPQNLFLYTYFNIPTGEFVLIMLPPFIASIILMTLCCLAIKPVPLVIQAKAPTPDRKQTAICFALFLLCIMVVFRIVPYVIGLAIIFIVLLITDREALYKVDYPLLGTFAAFFVFAGNMARITAVQTLFSSVLSDNVMMISAGLSQIISNVPAAIMLSQFTDDYSHLLLGVNIGGMGTIIASLASLITYREYILHNPGKSGHFLGVFSAFGFGFLFVLLGMETLIS